MLDKSPHHITIPSMMYAQLMDAIEEFNRDRKLSAPVVATLVAEQNNFMLILIENATHAAYFHIGVYYQIKVYEYFNGTSRVTSF